MQRDRSESEVVYLATLQFSVGGLFDSEPTDGVGHLIRGTHRGTPGPTLCGIDRCRPPEHVQAYHKHDCLCVLGRGDEALTQLLDWIDKLRAHGATVRVEDKRYERPPDLITLALSGGSTNAVISFPDLPEDDKTVYYWETRSANA